MTTPGPFGVSAEAYDQWIGRYSTPLAVALTDFSGVLPESRALDVGCGPGALTEVLAERFGSERVVAIDPSESFVEACRLRLPGVQVLSASGEALPFPQDSFGATFAQLAVNFMDEPTVAVREMRRVTRRGGVVAACVWDYAGEMTLLGAFWRAAREVDSQRAAAVDEAKLFGKFDRDGLATLWRETGFRDVRTAPLVVSASYAGFEDLWSPLPRGVGPAGAFCASLEAEQQGDLHDAFRADLNVGEGPFELTARAWGVAGTA